MTGEPRRVRVQLRADVPEGSSKGLLADDHRTRTLRKVLVSYPEVRHILPDRVTLDPSADPRVLETVAKFLERQRWLVVSAEVE